jgi:hypothetical protein
VARRVPGTKELAKEKARHQIPIGAIPFTSFPRVRDPLREAK